MRELVQYATVKCDHLKEYFDLIDISGVVVVEGEICATGACNDPEAFFGARCAYHRESKMLCELRGCDAHLGIHRPSHCGDVSYASIWYLIHEYTFI